MDSNLIHKIKQVLVEPINFFESLKREEGIKSAFIYLMILSLFSTLLGLIGKQLFQNYSYYFMLKVFGLSLPKPQYTASILTLSAFFGYGVGLISSFLMAGVLHVWILIFGGKENYSKAYQLYVYSKTPSFVAGWIPFFGYLVWLYDLVLLIIGTQKLYGIPKIRSILMYVIPILLIGLSFLGIILFLTYVLKSNPDIFSLNLSQNFTLPQ